jgi:Lon protease-like protein
VTDSGPSGAGSGDPAVLPRVIPLFPLPDVVVFPQVVLPLHIFEPRYRAMVADARDGDRVIGMCLLRPGWEPDYHGRPPVFPQGCAGRVEKLEELPDGRFNILLRGLARFRVLSEIPGGAYRRVEVERLPDPFGTSAVLDQARRRVMAAIGRASDGPAVLVMHDQMPHDQFLNALCQSLPLAAVERQSLLDCEGIADRYQRLLEIMEFRELESGQGPAGSRRIH